MLGIFTITLYNILKQLLFTAGAVHMFGSAEPEVVVNNNLKYTKDRQ